MRQKILGVAGVLWGGTLLLLHFLSGGLSPVAGGGAYAAGQSFGLLFADLLVVVGIYYLARPIPPKQ